MAPAAATGFSFHHGERSRASRRSPEDGGSQTKPRTRPSAVPPHAHDGRVDMQVGGEAGEVDAFPEAIEESELKSHIRKVDARAIPPLSGVTGFDISH